MVNTLPVRWTQKFWLEAARDIGIYVEDKNQELLLMFQINTIVRLP